MAVLVECISVIIRVDRLLVAIRGDWERFKDHAPNATLCSDNELVRVGFMHPGDVENFVAELEEMGLRYRRDGLAQDLVVVDQQTGLLVPCDWAEVGKIPWEGNEATTITACRLKGSSSNQVHTPEEWSYPGSLSEKFRFVPSGATDDAVLQRDEQGMQTYRRSADDTLQYVGRVKRYSASGTNDVPAPGRISRLLRSFGRH